MAPVRRRRPRHFLEAGVFRVLLAAARILPRRALLALGSLAGTIGYHVDRRHTAIARDNLRHAFPERTETERIVIAKACWRHFCRITCEALGYPRLMKEDVPKLVRYEGLDHIRAAYASGKGVLQFTGHFGNWEMAGVMQGFLGLPLSVIARPLDNPLLERTLARLRGLSGNTVVHKRQAVREMLRVLHAGGGIALVIDQDARDAGVFVPFLGRPASTTPTLGMLALRTGAVVLGTFAVPEPDGRYRIIVTPPVTIEPSGDRDEDILRWTAKCTAILEEWVRRRPELWLWLHRRWKTQPQDSRS